MSFDNQNFYEGLGGDVRFENNQVTFSSQPAPTSQKTATENEPPKRSMKVTWRITAVILGFAIIGLLAFIIVLVAKLAGAGAGAGTGAGAQNGSEASSKNCSGTLEARTFAESCKELNKRGTNPTGIYRIKPDDESAEIEAYCDMETDGGGWTLVASVHESDVRQKCYSDDLWSSYVPRDRNPLTASTSWENEMTFGNVHKCTLNDYKNAAYYKLNASDVMLWHVQYGVLPDTMKTSTAYRYRTTDHFLTRYGGNLKSLYTEHYPLTVKSGQNSEKILDGLMKKGSVIKALIPNWYEYQVTGSQQIRDIHMFLNYGNYIYFRTATETISVPHNGREYRLYRSQTTFKSSAVDPFILIAIVLNEDRISQRFSIESQSRRPASTDVVSEFENTTILANYKLQYRALQLYNVDYPTPCLFFFVVSNSEDWKSIEPSTFTLDYEYNVNTQRNYRYRIDGSPKNVVFGYMLLARQAGYNVTSEQLNNVASVTLKTIASLPNVFRAPSEQNTLAVPATFDVGSIADMLNMVPPDLRDYVQSGFLQFRAYNYTGYPSAICPGVKVSTISPEYVCIGGISGDIGEHGTCGDYAGWGGKSGDTVLGNQASGHAHAHKDMLATILIFYR